LKIADFRLKALRKVGFHSAIKNHQSEIASGRVKRPEIAAMANRPYLQPPAR
jgi:hypothetical protein